MENNDKKITTNQPDLFQQLSDEPEYLSENALDLDLEQEILGAIKYALRESKKIGLGRERIVERMNLCLPEELHVTKRQLDAWCAESQEYKRFPLVHLAAFIWATKGIVSPLEVITRALGFFLLDKNEHKAAEIGRYAVIKTEAAQMERILKRQLQR